MHLLSAFFTKTFLLESDRPQTRIATTKQGLRRDETGVINQSGGKYKDDRK